MRTPWGVKERFQRPSAAQRIQLLLSSPDRLLWAVHVRWLAIGGFVALSLAAHAGGLFDSATPILIGALVGSVLNSANGWCVRHRRHILLVSVVAMPMDHVVSTFLIVHTGGAQSPFLGVYAVQVVATAMLVDRAVAALSAVLAVALWTCALYGQSQGWVPVPPLFATGHAPSLAVYHITLAAFLLYALGLLIYLGGYVSERLRVSESELADRNRSLEAAMQAMSEAHEKLQDAYSRQRAAEAQLVQSEKMRGLGSLVAGVAHELNNPVSFVAGNVAHLRSYVGRLQAMLVLYEGSDLVLAQREQLRQRREELQIDMINADLAQLLDDCEEGARRTREIVLGLRDFSRIDAGDCWQVADLRTAIDSTLALAAPRLRGRIQVHRNYADVPDVECLPGQLNQVFLNLITNSADACGESGNLWITLFATTVDDVESLVLSFRDDGCGIPADIQDRIFEPFFTTKPVGQGTGLGLSVSYGIVQRHHGTLTVASQPGQGATFRMTLPKRQPPRTTQSHGNATGDSNLAVN